MIAVRCNWESCSAVSIRETRRDADALRPQLQSDPTPKAIYSFFVRILVPPPIIMISDSLYIAAQNDASLLKGIAVLGSLVRLRLVVLPGRRERRDTDTSHRRTMLPSRKAPSLVTCR